MKRMDWNGWRGCGAAAAVVCAAAMLSSLSCARRESTARVNEDEGTAKVGEAAVAEAGPTEGVDAPGAGRAAEGEVAAGAEAGSDAGADQREEPAVAATPGQPVDGAGVGGALAETYAFTELFPGVRVDVKGRVVEFDGVVPIEAHDQDAPRVDLEVIVCARDTKEHESLVMTNARASHVHAALLLIGLTAGKPGSWDFSGERIVPVPPEGEAVRVSFVLTGEDGAERVVNPMSWVRNVRTGRRLSEDEGGNEGGGATFLFAGSRVMRVSREAGAPEVYDADRAGTIVGLCTFGTETVAWREVVSPDSTQQEPELVAVNEEVPAFGTAVKVRISAVNAR